MRKPRGAFLSPARGSAPTLIREPQRIGLISQHQRSSLIRRCVIGDNASIEGEVTFSKRFGSSNFQVEMAFRN